MRQTNLLSLRCTPHLDPKCLTWVKLGGSSPGKSQLWDILKTSSPECLEKVNHKKVNITMRYDLTRLRMAIKKKKQTENNKCWQVYIERWESCTQLMSVQNVTATVEDSMVVPQKIKCGIIQDPATPLLSIDPKESYAETWIDICASMFIVLFTVGKVWKKLKYSLTDG